MKQYSPHAWGWTSCNRRKNRARCVFPTRVGMDHNLHKSGAHYLSIPHTRGDGPSSYEARGSLCPYSPHAWGWTVALWHAACINSRIPHTRGDGPICRKKPCQEEQYFPHAWGWTVHPARILPIGRVFPTRVGMDQQLIIFPVLLNRIPHTRGDGPIGVRRIHLILHVFPTRVGMDHPSLRRLTNCSIPTHAWGWTVLTR